MRNYILKGGQTMDWLKQLPKKWLLLGSGASIVILITLFVGIYLMVNKEPRVDTTMWEETSLTTTAEVATDATKERAETMIYVDIKGAVKVPGIYQLKNQQRIWDALALAGGVSEEADTAQVNYAQKVKDQMIIYVPKKGESVAQSLETLQESAPAQQNQEEKINLNTATEAELQTISGIGAKKAQEIIRFRDEQGPFKTVEELKNVPGIGEKTVERLKDMLTVTG
ncbi:TPA: helix-hairpin-helix domain-containing protein [Enterococcus faecalis]|uniref:helix-hairpin-helix domain-containing protein n=1 Tax=Enterococcus faecalis TaxID=1351 RepID=UPI00156DD6E1|nr:helix-hairpin-helix domain-containing protein [Enterococcus faecalis]EHQ8833551.1 helix-hairpin-helix domain-containing protein [Enterococcus faecalis]EIB3065868.1 helix-hairpin-helix domain-containing protein [Enterococcus faecalis]EKZ0109946.1 helix-hairpin-helix domain-containing protein [Enterococcus faecalis]ELY1997764.1 helix-hairpin-helix domain-containing protein [Enterococcus faecalis]MBD9844493.1 helix-hairpin-helix domain-containing protein [Enterococcus faecalis]